MKQRLQRFRARLRRHLRSFDESLIHLAHTLRHQLLWPALIAMAVGGATWIFRHWARSGAMSTNQLGFPERMQLLRYVGVAAIVWLVALGAMVAVRRWRRGRWQVVRSNADLTRASSFLMALPFVAALGQPKIEASSPKLCFFYAACAALACVPTLVALAREPRGSGIEGEPSRWHRWLLATGRWGAPLLVLGMGIGYAWFFSRLAIINHHAFNTRTVDLGYYDNIFYQSAHGRPLACTFIRAGYHGSAHFDPILVLLSPLYRLRPSAEFLLVLQSAWLAAGVIPAYLIARSKLDSRPAGVVLAAAYALYPAMHGANMYEFHSLTLLATPLMFALYFLEIGSARAYLAMVGICLLVREDAALIMCFVGAHALLTRRAGLGRLGWITIASSLAYFAVVKKFFMTSSDVFMGGKDAYSFAYYYRDLIPEGSGVGGFVASLVVNPVFAIQHALQEPKLVYLATLLVPLGLLPLLAKPGRLLLLYGAIFLLLASREPVYQPSFQYSVVLFPMLMALTPVAIHRLEDGRAREWLGLSRRQLRAATLGCVLVCSLLVSWKFGGLVDNQRFRGGFTRVARSLTDQQKVVYAQFRGLLDQIPRGASLTVTNIVGAHGSNRKEAYFYHQKKPTDYVLIDDRDMKGDVRDWHQKRLQRGELVQIGTAGTTIKLFRAEHGRPVPEEPAASATAAPSAKPPGDRRPNKPPTPIKPRPGDPSPEDSDRLEPPEGWPSPEAE